MPNHVLSSASHTKHNKAKAYVLQIVNYLIFTCVVQMVGEQ